MLRQSTILGGFFLGVVVMSPGVPALAQTGVSDDRVSLPDGPGSLDGVGDNTSVNSNMGHMQTSVPVDVPGGYAGLTPDFNLSYSSGAGSGVVGIGWSMSLPSIERMTAKGLPLYDDDDLFVADGSVELVRVSSGEPAIYRARYEGAFVRYAWHNRGAGDAGFWTAEYPSGLVATFGALGDGSEEETARVRSSDGVFRYLITEVRDSFNHTLDYSYRFYGAVPLLDIVNWAQDRNGVARYSASFEYALRPDRISDARGGFNELLAHRLTTIRILSLEDSIRRYDLDYEDDETAGSISRLQTVTRVGKDGGAYGVAYSFEYSRSIAGVCDGTDCEEPLLVNAGNIGSSFATGRVNFIDINGDGLPDAVESQAQGPHRIYLSEMSVDGVHTFAAPFDSAVGDAGGFEMSSPYTQVLDVNGDGFTDLLNSLTGRVLINRGTGDWDEETTLGGNASLPDFSEDFELGEDGQLEHIRFLDVDADRRIDVIRSDAVGTSMFINMGENGFVADTSVQPIEAGFADDSTDLADMNGDGLLDPIQIREALVRYRIHLGRGQWSAWTSISGAPITFEDIPFTSLEDLNGDGIDDIVAVVGGQVKYALNRNSLVFTDQESLTSTRGQPLPVDDGTITVLFADMNANGSTDVVYVDDAGEVTYLDLFPVRPNLLSHIENGIGYTVDVEYATMVAERARTQGEGWDDPVPMPTIVVDKVDVYTDAPSADLIVHEVVNYDYEGGFYDGVEKQFRGFRIARQLEQTDAGEVLFVEEFDVGAGDNRGHFAGKPLRDSLRQDGALLRTINRSFEDCPLASIPDVTSLRTPILFACKTSEETVLQEKRPVAEWVTTRQEFSYDGYGNLATQDDLGVVDIGGGSCAPCTRAAGQTGAPCGAQCEGDEKFIAQEFVLPETNNDRWLLGLVAVATETAVVGVQGKENRFFYDGEPFTGLSAGGASTGLLTRETRLVVVGQAPVTSTRSRFDAHGNLVESIAPTGPASGSHRVRTLFDDTGLFVVRTERDVGSGDDRITLARDYTNTSPFGHVTSSSAWYRVGEDPSSTRTQYTYDEHGRLSSLTKPGEGSDVTTEEYDYDLTSPYSRITTRARSSKAGALDVESIRCVDGLGRTVQTRRRVDAGRFIASGLSIFDRRGNPVRVFRSSTATTGDCEPPSDDAVSTSYAYDALDRETLVTLADASATGGASTRRTEYLPLATYFYNEDDNDTTSPALNTPNIAESDGLGRLTATIRTGSDGELERSEILYDTLGRIAGVIDAQGNTKSQRYDLLDRVVEVSDPDANVVTFAYDAEGNMVRSEDARGVVTRRTFDEVGRQLEEWDDADRGATLKAWVYDLDPACAACANQANHIVATSFQSPLGAVRETLEYDVRGNVVAIGQTAQGLELKIEYAFDNIDRPTTTIFPDGQQTSNVYDLAGRVVAVDGAIASISYTDFAEISGFNLAGGVQANFTFDERSSLISSKVEVNGNPVVDLSFTRDRLTKVVAVEDALRIGSDALNAAMNYDALGCLQEVIYDDERLEFTSDSLSRIIQKDSSLGAVSAAHVGRLLYEDSVAVRRLTTAGDIAWSYDDAGYATRRASDAFSFDYNGRISQVQRSDEVVLEVARTPSGDRILTREGARVRRHLGEGFEIRDGISRVNVQVGADTVVVLESDALAASVFEDQNGDGVIDAGDAFLARGAPDQRVMLRSAARRALLSTQGARTIVVPDAQGSTVAVIGDDGTVRERISYYPFGGVRHSTARETEFARYTGKEHDVTGYLDFGERMLAPREGRWLSPDLSFLILTGKVVSSPAEAFSAYAYVGNDPMNFVDVDGRKSENRNGMPTNLRSGIETLAGASVDSVRVHYNSSKPASLNARAYAQGTNIHVASGAALPHEAWHVVQQSQDSVAPTSSAAGVQVNSSGSVEREADSLGVSALSSAGGGGDTASTTAHADAARSSAGSDTVRTRPRSGAISTPSTTKATQRNNRAVTAVATPAKAKVSKAKGASGGKRTSLKRKGAAKLRRAVKKVVKARTAARPAAKSK